MGFKFSHTGFVGFSSLMPTSYSFNNFLLNPEPENAIHTRTRRSADDVLEKGFIPANYSIHELPPNATGIT